MERTIVIDFSTGTLRCLYTEDLNLAGLGRMRVERASHVEFDAEKQGWFIWTPDWRLIDQPEGGFKSRKDALAFEERWANATLLAG